MDVRTSGKLKGVKPGIVTIKANEGKIYRGPRATFIMSMKGSTLHFQKLSTFLHRLKPEDDFSLDLGIVTEYGFVSTRFLSALYLYDKHDRHLCVFYPVGTKDTYPTEDNVYRMIQEFKKMGIKERKSGDDLDEGADSGAEEPNKEI